MKTKVIVFLIIVPLVIFSDQGSKIWIERHFSHGQSVEIVQNFFHITYIRNTGGAFGVFSRIRSPFFQKIFVFVTLITVVLMGFLYGKLQSCHYGPAIALTLIIGGAGGNLIDRIRLGWVIDFIDLHFYSYHWPAFNIADSAITVGSFVLGAYIILKKW